MSLTIAAIVVVIAILFGLAAYALSRALSAAPKDGS